MLGPHAPSVSVQPTNQLVQLGDTATFTAAARGSVPLHYQWRKDGTNISGATNVSWTVSNVQSNHFGNYAVVVTNLFGAATSSVATLGLTRDFFDNFEPGIHGLRWSSFSPTVAANSFAGSVSGGNALWFGGGTTRFAQTRAIDTTGGGVVDFYLRFADTNAGPNWNTVDLPGGIVLDYSPDGGASWTRFRHYNAALFHGWTHVVEVLPVYAQSPATSFRWEQVSRREQNGDHWALDDVAVIMRLEPPIIISAPFNQIVRTGNNPNFYVAVAGSAPVYQWQRDGTNLIEAGRFSGTTSSTLFIANALESDAGTYSLAVSNAAGSVTASFTLTVIAVDHFTWAPISSPQIGNSPFPVTIEARDNLDQLVTNFSGSVSLYSLYGPVTPATTGPFTNGVWSGSIAVSDPVPGMKLEAATSIGSYYFNGWSMPFDVVLSSQLPTILAQPTNQLLRAGSNAAFSVRAYGPEPFTYQWRRNGTNLTDDVRISGATSPSLTVANISADDTGSYSVVISNTNGGTTSANATLTLDLLDHFTWTIPSPATTHLRGLFYPVTIQARGASNQIITTFTKPVALSGIITGTSVSLSVTPSMSGNFTNGVWSGSLMVSNLATNIMFRADDGAGRVGLSPSFHVAPANQPPIFLVHPANQVVRPGTNITLFANAFGAGGYIWWGGTNTNFPLSGPRYGGQTTATFTISNAVESDTATYTAVATANGLPPLQTTSSVATILVTPLDHFTWSAIPSPQGTNLAFDVMVTARDSANQLFTNYTRSHSLSAAMGGDEPVTCTPAFANFVSGVWTGSVRITQIASNVVLRITDGFGHTGDSVPIDVLAQAPVIFTLQPTNQFVQPGTNVTLVAQAFSPSPVTYQWRFEGTNILNATNASYTFTDATLTDHHGYFSCVAMDDCSTAVSSNALISVLVKPGVVTHIQPVSALQGRTAVLSLVATGAPPLGYRWIRNGATYTTTTVPFLFISNVQATANFRVFVTNSANLIGAFSPGPSIIHNVPLTMIPDADGDGISDAWELHYGFNPTNAPDALLDFDGDGMSNGDEYVAGTNPTNAGSVLRIVLTATNANVLQFVAQTNISYSAQWRTNPSATGWNNLTNISAHSLVRTVQVNTTPLLPLPERYLRIVTPQAP